jgi:hypothetical protein
MDHQDLSQAELKSPSNTGVIHLKQARDELPEEAARFP